MHLLVFMEAFVPLLGCGGSGAGPGLAWFVLFVFLGLGGVVGLAALVPAFGFSFLCRLLCVFIHPTLFGLACVQRRWVHLLASDVDRSCLGVLIVFYIYVFI